jgi:hypothetical protein
MSAKIISMSKAMEGDGLPSHPEELLNLPGKLGKLQDYIYGRMSYPCRATAGFYSLVVMTMLLQTNNTINSRDGLGLNEYYLGLAPTGFGKEEVRKIVSQIYAEMGIAFTFHGVKLHYAAPASMQGIHELLENGRSAFFMADEFANWMKQSGTDSNKSNALNYLMECYTKATGTVFCGHAKTVQYFPVRNPRLSIIATSTGEAMFESLTKAQAESGAYNRWLIFVGPQKLPKKRYTGLVYDIPEDLLAWLKDMSGLTDNGRYEEGQSEGIGFSVKGFEKFIELDQQLAEPVKAKDGVIGGRLAEQAIKIAGVIAMCEGHKHIGPEDMETAFKIRLGLYHRAAASIRAESAIEGGDTLGKAKKQLAKAIEKHGVVYISQLEKNSRAYAKLSMRDQRAVQEALVREGVCNRDGKKLVATPD